MMSSALSASKDFSTIFRRSPALRSAELLAVARLRTAGFFWVMASVSSCRGTGPAALFHTPDLAAALRFLRISVAEIGLSR